jgi:hypothetical protein
MKPRAAPVEEPTVTEVAAELPVLSEEVAS